jgi:hypothetical protein
MSGEGDSRFKIPDSGFQIPDSRFKIQDSGRIPKFFGILEF